MKAWILLADAIKMTAQRDGTFGALRAGINQFTSTKYPAEFTASMIARFYGFSEADVKRSHTFRLEFVDEEGEKVLGPIEGLVSAPQVDGQSFLTADLRATLQRAGSYHVKLSVDEELHDVWILIAREGKPNA